MKEKISLKRQSRRCKSESSSKEQHSSSSSSNNNGKLMKDGKEICPIPLVECICPGQAVNKDDPQESVKMLCSNQSCYFSSNAYVHMVCYKALEDQMYTLLKHLGHKTSNWTDTQIRQNLWDRKGLTLIQTQIRCPCGGGISLRDEDAWIHHHEKTIEIKNDKKRKQKKKNLPNIVTRARCESENAPPQYDPHEPDDFLDPALPTTRLSKIRLENNGSSSKKNSKKASTFKLEKSPEVEFPSINNRASRRTASLCETGAAMKLPSSYNKVVATGLDLIKNNVEKSVMTDSFDSGLFSASAQSNFTTKKDVIRNRAASLDDPYDFLISSVSSVASLFTSSINDFNRAPGTPVRDKNDSFGIPQLANVLNSIMDDPLPEFDAQLSFDRRRPSTASFGIPNFKAHVSSNGDMGLSASCGTSSFGVHASRNGVKASFGNSSDFYSNGSSVGNDYRNGSPILSRSRPASTSSSSSTFHQMLKTSRPELPEPQEDQFHSADEGFDIDWLPSRASESKKDVDPYDLKWMFPPESKSKKDDDDGYQLFK